jgi:hypothetical protein
MKDKIILILIGIAGIFIGLVIQGIFNPYNIQISNVSKFLGIVNILIGVIALYIAFKKK